MFNPSESEEFFFCAIYHPFTSQNRVCNSALRSVATVGAERVVHAAAVFPDKSP